MAIHYMKMKGLSDPERGQLAALDQSPRDGALSGIELGRGLIVRVYDAALAALFRLGLEKTSPQRQCIIALFREFQPPLQVRMLLQLSSLRQRELLLSLIDPTSADPLRDLGYVLHQLPMVDDGMWGALIFAGLRDINPRLVIAAQQAALSYSYGDVRARLQVYLQTSQRFPEIRPLDHGPAAGIVTMGYFPNLEAARRYMRRHHYPEMSLPQNGMERYALHMAGRAAGIMLIVHGSLAQLVLPMRGYKPTMLAQSPRIPPEITAPGISIMENIKTIERLMTEGHALAIGQHPDHAAALKKFEAVLELDKWDFSAQFFAASEYAALGDHETAYKMRELIVTRWENALAGNANYFKMFPEEQMIYDSAKASLKFVQAMAE